MTTTLHDTIGAVVTDDTADTAAAQVLAHALATTGRTDVLDALDGLTAGHFRSNADRTIWQAILDAGGTADLATLMVDLAHDRDAKGRLAAIGAAGVGVGIPEYAAHFADVLRTAAEQRAARQALTGALNALSAGEDPRDALALAMAEADPSWTPRTPFDAEVERKAHALRVQRAATRLVDRDGLPPRKPLNMGFLSEYTTDDELVRWRVDGLLMEGGSMLVAAQKKAGKSTWSMNLVRYLINGGDFLGQFHVDPIEDGHAVGYVNAELPPGMFAQWLRDMGVDPSRVFVVHTRDACSDILGDHEARVEIATAMRAANVSVLVADPFTALATPVAEQDNREVRSWLEDLNRFARDECGASELVLCHHAGHGAPGTPVRPRGASAFGDWADSVVILTNPEGRQDSERYMAAYGRDVNVHEDRLEHDPATRRLVLSGEGGHREKKAGDTFTRQRTLVENIVRQHRGCGFADIERLGRELRAKDPTRPSLTGKGIVSKAAKALQDDGLIRIEDLGPGRGVRCYSTSTV